MSHPLGARAGEGPLAPRQLEILQIIARSVEQRGYPPTYAEFEIALGVTSRATIHEHLSRLEAKQMLTRHARSARALTLTAAARAELARARAKQRRSEKRK